MRKFGALLLAIISLSVLGCQPINTPPPTPIACVIATETPVYDVADCPQEAGTALGEGDSVSFQMLYGGGATPGVEWNAIIGATTSACNESLFPGCVPAYRHLPEQVRQGKASRVVWALGFNDDNEVWNGGWDDNDVAYHTLTLKAVPQTSCLVIILPALGNGARPAYEVEVQENRQWLLQYAASRPGTIIVDWDPYAKTPGILDTDALHLQMSITQVEADATTLTTTDMVEIDQNLDAAQDPSIEGTETMPVPAVAPGPAARAELVNNGLAQCPAA